MRQPNESSSFQALLEKIKNKMPVLIDGVDEAQRAFTITFLEKSFKRDILIISSDRKKDLLYKNLSYSAANLLEFPAWETSPHEEIRPSLDIVGKRFEVLNVLLKKEKTHILICTLHSLSQKILPAQIAKNLFLHLSVKASLDFEDFLIKLVNLGYEKSSIVSDKGQFALRGGIIDIFPANLENPYRIEFFADEIESIRSFDLTTQKSTGKADFIDIYPSDELSLIKNSENLSAVLSYLSEDYLVIFDDIYQIEENLVALNLQPSKYFLSLADLLKNFENRQKIYFSEKKIEFLCAAVRKGKEKYFQNIDFEIFNTSLNAYLWFHPFLSYADFLKKENIENILDSIPAILDKNLKIVFLTSSQGEKKHLLELLEGKKLSRNEFIFEDGFLSSGFILSDILLCVVPYNEITRRKIIRRQKFRQTHQTPYSEYHHLEIGDLVVHYHSGIGKYLGCEKHSNHLGIETEFLVIEYAQNSKLYVPLSQAHLISRYIGDGDEKPNLSRLGAAKWQKTKNTAQIQILGYAGDLLRAHSQREAEGGFEYPKDSEETALFEMDFPYAETQDQLNAINEIKKDMQSKKAMDRLICGDVGYGKTEVAMRCAFKAVFDGKKQAAVLVPTTVLAMQHYDTFKERMSSFPINIEVLSRFNTVKRNKEILSDVEKGKVDILIGTHRLLSKDVFFKDLGLIIIDEEQRFGVRAKEHLKKFKKGVDCVTLSATPIPRTLYMSLIKVKDMSVINTPPQDRLPIKTILAQNDDLVIKNALLREFSRQGQVFFIHNRVESIYNRRDHIKQLVPDYKMAIVHGQMPADEVDYIFHDFKKGLIDVLFSTTIIENGIDVPNANTIIIDRADTFGLADLYQLRGRVGRWNRAAYAYFITPKNREISEISQKRLRALLEAGGYGGGMKIALRDLELRGAGDILGVKQSGQISNIGFHLYCKLLKKAVSILKNKKEALFIETKIEFPYAAFLPENYVPHANLRMEIYYRLGEAFSYDEVDKIQEELADRFGALPTEVKELLNLTKIRVFANQNNFTCLKFGDLTLSAERQVKDKKNQKILILPRKTAPDEFKDKVLRLLKDSFDIF